MHLFITCHLPDFTFALFLKTQASNDILNVHHTELSLASKSSVDNRWTKVMLPPHSFNIFKSYVTSSLYSSGLPMTKKSIQQNRSAGLESRLIGTHHHFHLSLHRNQVNIQTESGVWSLRSIRF